MYWCTLACVLGFVQGPQAASREPITTEDLCQALCAQQEALDGLLLRFDVEHFYGAGTAMPPPEGPRSEHFSFLSRNTALVAGAKYRLEKVYVKTTESLQGLVGDYSLYTWDGVVSRSIRRDADERIPESLLLDAAPPRSQYDDLYLSWLGWWVLQSSKRLSYCDLICYKRVTDPELMEDGRTRWVLPLLGGPATYVLMYGRQGENGVELSEVELRAYTEPHLDHQDDSGLTVSSRIQFDPIDAESECPIATSARMVQSHRRENPSDEFWFLTRISLRSAEQIVTTPLTFREPVGSGAAVADSRYRISYVIGSTVLNLDGRVIDTHEPLHGEVGHKLEWWVENARFSPLFDPTTKESARESPATERGDREWSGSVRHPVLLVVCIVVAAAILIMGRKSVR